MHVEQTEVKEWVRAVRGKLSLSQSQLASMLGVSSRAVQSYEQGWRELPRPVAAQLMTVLALHRDHPNQSPPCWSLTGCTAEARGRCAAVSVGRGHFCWLLSGRACGNRNKPGRASGQQSCIGCVVMRRMLDGPCGQRTVAAGEPSSTGSTEEEQK